MEQPEENLAQEPPKKYLRLGDLECYRVSFALSNRVWEVVARWPLLAQRTIGEQFIRAADSIPANIAEGFGRYIKSGFTGLPTVRYLNASTGMKRPNSANYFRLKNINTCFPNSSVSPDC